MAALAPEGVRERALAQGALGEGQEEGRPVEVAVVLADQGGRACLEGRAGLQGVVAAWGVQVVDQATLAGLEAAAVAAHTQKRSAALPAG